MLALAAEPAKRGSITVSTETLAFPGPSGGGVVLRVSVLCVCEDRVSHKVEAGRGELHLFSHRPPSPAPPLRTGGGDAVSTPAQATEGQGPGQAAARGQKWSLPLVAAQICVPSRPTANLYLL